MASANQKTIGNMTKGQLRLFVEKHAPSGGGGGGAVTAVANGADNRIATFSSSTALNGEANLVFDGTDVSVAAAGKVEFGGADSGQHIYESTDNQLDIDATTLIELTAPTIELAGSTKIDLQSDAVSIGENGDTDVVLTFNGNTSDGTITWMEDEAEFRFSHPTRGKLLHYSHYIYSKNSGYNKHYIPMGGNVSDSTTWYFQHGWLAPHDGKLLKVFLRTGGYNNFGVKYGGSTIVGLHLDANATAVTTDTQTLADGTTYTYTFTSNNTFTAGQMLSLSAHNSTNMGDVWATAIWEYDTTT